MQLSKRRLQKINIEQQRSISKLGSLQFSFNSFSTNPSTFKYLCGLTIEKFTILFNIILPCVHFIKYPDCKGTGYRSLDKQTELFSFLTLCRHSLHLGIMGHMLNVSQSTVNRLFIGWAVFLETLFAQLNLKPPNGFLIQKMPDIFIKTGHGLTEIL